MTPSDLLVRLRAFPPGTLVPAGWVAEQLEQALPKPSQAERRGDGGVEATVEGETGLNAQEPRRGPIGAGPSPSTTPASRSVQPRGAARGRAS